MIYKEKHYSALWNRIHLVGSDLKWRFYSIFMTIKKSNNPAVLLLDIFLLYASMSPFSARVPHQPPFPCEGILVR